MQIPAPESVGSGIARRITRLRNRIYYSCIPFFVEMDTFYSHGRLDTGTLTQSQISLKVGVGPFLSGILGLTKGDDGDSCGFWGGLERGTGKWKSLGFWEHCSTFGGNG